MMRKIWVLFISILIGLFLSGCSSIKKVAVGADINDLIKNHPLFSSHFTGFSLYDITFDEFITNINAEKAFTPASNTKLLTTYFVLRNFPDSIPSLVYERNNGLTKVSFIGNPSFLHPSFPEFQQAYNFLKNQDSLSVYFPEPINRFGSGWAWDDYSYYFQPEVNPFPIYGNVVSVSFDDSIKVIPPFFTEYVDIVMDEKESFPRRSVNYNTFYVKKDTQEVEIPFITSQELFMELLSDTLNQKLIRSDQKLVKTDTIYDMATDHVLAYMMASSDNLFAEQLLLMCAYKNGYDNIQSYISDIKGQYLTELGAFRWVDGSGLSRYNLITPIGIVRLLSKMYLDTNWERLSKIMVQGGEGTLKNYYQSEDPYIWAKTGTLSNNHNLSGYLSTNNGRLLAFSFMNNNYLDPTSEIKEEMEELIKKIKDAY